MRKIFVVYLLLLLPLWTDGNLKNIFQVWADTSSSQVIRSGREMGRGTVSQTRFAEEVFDDLAVNDEPSLSCPEFYELLKKNKSKLNFNCLSDSQFTSIDLWISDETLFWELIELMETNICYVDTLYFTTVQDIVGSPIEWPIMKYFSHCKMYDIGGKVYEADGKTLRKHYSAVDLSLLNKELLTLNIQRMNIIDISEIYEFTDLGFLSLSSCIYEGELNFSHLKSVKRLNLRELKSTIDFEQFCQMPNLEILTVQEVGGVKNFHAIEQLQAQIICIDESLYFEELDFIERLKKIKPELKVITGWD